MSIVIIWHHSYFWRTGLSNANWGTLGLYPRGLTQKSAPHSRKKLITPGQKQLKYESPISRPGKEEDLD